MEEKGPMKITLWKQSSLAPDRHKDGIEREFSVDFSDIDPTFRLMCFANEGDVEGLKELLDSGVDVNFKDIDARTALHIAACQGWPEIISLLIQHGADIDAKDRWGSTPLADATHYKNHDVVKILESKGAKPLTAPMHVKHAREVPEYEIKQTELDFANSVDLDKGTFTVARWHGTKVAVKRLAEDVTTDDEKVGAFRDELELLVKIRHPNVVQFLGAVTQTSPMMIVTEYLPKGDLRQYLKTKGQLEPIKAVVFALDIARGMNYLHELKPAIIHRDLEPSNILKDDTGHLKVADFGVSKLLTVKSSRPLTCQDTACRYVAPEVFRDGEYDTKVDVFSFALILHEMIEGCQPFSVKNDKEVLKAYKARERPPFTASSKHYSHGLKELIEACWHDNPSKRPTFKEIIVKLEHIHYSLTHKSRWKVRPMKCFNNFEAMLKRDNSDLSRSSSTRSTNSI